MDFKAYKYIHYICRLSRTLLIISRTSADKWRKMHIRLCLSPILFLYNIYSRFCKANSQSLLAILQTCLTSAASDKCVAIYPSVGMVLIA